MSAARNWKKRSIPSVNAIRARPTRFVPLIRSLPAAIGSATGRLLLNYPAMPRAELFMPAVISFEPRVIQTIPFHALDFPKVQTA